MRLTRQPLSAVLVALLSVAAVHASHVGPQGVSPGAPDRLALVDGGCPTFTWEATSGTQRYELVVYRLDGESNDELAFGVIPENEVLYTSISGLATAWTPEAINCFNTGESYVWFIRAVTDIETGEGGEWSEPRFFEVEAVPSAEELARAVEVIRRWQAAGGNGLLSQPSETATDSAAASAPDSGTGSGTGSGSSRPKSVTTGTAAIRGEQPDLSGETYGVVGTSSSPDGAGIGAANTAGGPDLVLDGAVPAEMTETGIDRPSASPQTFSFSNTGGGGMTLDVDGVEVVTTATDHDAVGALSCAPGELAKWNGATWVCASDLDTDTDTLAALAPCDFGEVAKWTGSAWECYTDWDLLYNLGCGSNQIARHNGTGWECADQSSVYDLGPGLILDGDQIRIDPAAFSAQISTLDSGGVVGLYSSIAIGSDGLGLISYYDATNEDLKVAHCVDVVCSSATISTLDSVGSVGGSTSIAIGADGLGIIAYHDNTNQHLKVAHCDDIACTSATTATVDNSSMTGAQTSIAIGTDGLGIISHLDYDNFDLRVTHCDDTACSSGISSTIDSTHNVGSYSSITIGTDGLGIISYFDMSNGHGKVAHCQDTVCTTATTSTLDHGLHTLEGWSTSIAIGADGLGIIAYSDNANDDLKVAHCNNIGCINPTTITVDNVGQVGQYTSIAIGVDGRAYISYFDETNSSLKVAHCADVPCTTVNATSLDLVGTVGWYTSIVIGADGVALISYYDQTNGDLKVAHLGIGVP